MADETTKQAETETKTKIQNDDRSLRSAVIGTSIILWILAIFMINIMNSMNSKFDKIANYMESYISIAGRPQLETYQLVDKDGNLAYTFRINPEMLPPEDMIQEVPEDLPVEPAK